MEVDTLSYGACSCAGRVACMCFSAVSCAISVIEMVVKNFATLIKTTISGPQPTTVDIAAEERSVNDT